MRTRPRRTDLDALGLTPRESECIGHKLAGMSQLQIAKVTGLSVGTVKCHLSTGYSHLNVRNHAGLVSYVARRAGIDLRMLFEDLRHGRKGTR